MLKPICSNGETDLKQKLFYFRNTVENLSLSSAEAEKQIYFVLSVLIHEEYIFFQTFEEILTNSQIALLQHEHSKNLVSKLFNILRRLSRLTSVDGGPTSCREAHQRPLLRFLQ